MAEIMEAVTAQPVVVAEPTELLGHPVRLRRIRSRRITGEHVRVARQGDPCRGSALVGVVPMSLQLGEGRRVDLDAVADPVLRRDSSAATSWRDPRTVRVA